MRKFITELVGKRVMTDDGLFLGRIDDFVMESNSGALVYLLLNTEGREMEMFKTDEKGRVVIPYRGIQSVRDVVVVNTD
ncbi:MAG: PRC-barrel domain-containing protein [Candidatus Methanomethylophilaceae archaeon]|jgi:sporulation protein YlmC with PRC-barrel domain|nr:PRC-barrel domain-containing protein [Candidatus Methanomethylophilaceae archaeon]NCB17566.1 PRC-barrel domain protein [Synergistales bacterium]